MVSKSSTEHQIICTLVQQAVMMHWSSMDTLLLASSITCLRNSKNKRKIPKIQLFSKRIQRNHNQLALLVSTPALVSQETITVKLAACGIRAGIVLVILVILFVTLVMFFAILVVLILVILLSSC